jgi:hypothetical protein
VLNNRQVDDILCVGACLLILCLLDCVVGWFDQKESYSTCLQGDDLVNTLHANLYLETFKG